ncbi:MAG: acyl-CoA dehydrogenase family protein [Anaerolineales bacterium]
MDFTLTEEQRLWRSTVHDFCENEIKPRAAELDARAEFPADAYVRMAPLGLLAMNIPEAHGGTGLDALSAMLALEELAWADGGTALSVAAHNGLGCAPITFFGSEAQKERWLPGLAQGNPGLGALALTEPSGGSDLAGSVQTRAERRGERWILNGSKAWITNASVAWVIVVLCRTGSTEGQEGLSLLVVPRDTVGVEVHPAEDKMGTRSSPTHALTFQDAAVPSDSLLGRAGEGLHQALQVLDGGRVGVGAIAVGLARAAFEEAVRYAKSRQAFGAPLAARQAIQWMIADAATQIEASRLLVHRAALLKDAGLPYTREAAMAKLFATEMAEKVSRDAIQIHGGYGYSREVPVERIYRDARLMTIGEGTSEIQRLVIARRTLGLED